MDVPNRCADPAWRVRPAFATDGPFLRSMLYEAAFWDTSGPRPPSGEVLAEPGLARYVEGWPRPGDAGVVAEDGAGRPIGAAWYRLFPADAPGYGYVDEATPEVSIAVEYASRGRGIGDQLLATLIATARRAGIRALSLSVARRNRAMTLYERHGFRAVALVGDSWTMRSDLKP